MSENGTATTTARILVVEDDRSLPDVLRFALSTGGFDVARRRERPARPDATRRDAPNAVVLDVALPDMVAPARHG